MTMTPDEKTISTTLLQMKFMQRTKNRLEEEKKRKMDESMKKSFLGSTVHVEDSASKRPKKESDKKPSSSSGVILEQRYEILEELRFGRMSFGGFNLEVEKLMKYYDDLKKGIQSEDDVLGEKDVSDTEMAAMLSGNLSISKKFSKYEARRQQRDDDRHDKRLIDESCVEGSKKRRSEERRFRNTK